MPNIPPNLVEKLELAEAHKAEMAAAQQAEGDALIARDRAVAVVAETGETRAAKTEQLRQTHAELRALVDELYQPK